MSEETITVPKSQLEAVLAQNKEQTAEIEALKNAVLNICGLLGLMDENGKVKPEVISGESNVMPTILKGAGDIVTLMTQAGIPVIGKKAKQKLEEKFAFIKDLLPLIQKYGT